MKSESFVHRIFGQELDKQMVADMEELIQAEQKTPQKLQPAYMADDYWKEKKEGRGHVSK